MRSRYAVRSRRARLALFATGSLTLKSMSSENRLISSQPFDSEVPPEKAGIMPAVSTCAITPIARTTCQSFSTRPGRVPRAAATSSTRRRSGTLETQIDPAVADPAADAARHADHTAGWHLCGLAGVVGLLETGWHRLDADAAGRLGQGR